MDGIGAGEHLETSDCRIDISRVDFDQPGTATRLLGSDQGSAAAAKDVEHDRIPACDIFDGIGDQRDRFDGRVHGEFGVPTSLKAISAGVAPNIGAVAAVLSQFDVIVMRAVAHLKDGDHFMCAAVQGTHSAVGLGPYADIEQPAVNLGADGDEVSDMSPIRSYEVDGAVA